ncbi:L-glyceraldehyde 3-phosphate reductase [Flavilitoribacter nigricans]|uniref:L-glyceraldehyde 3-phosphate reductase n=1 Tax=Flavilitoribacter nigricans (strain ATCC 23147 / DSM 23189 / NBRC 102662 / NCIMB 1420 / SS-2) TaxID=1122177 RepID=A0A2D0NG84_FLAN2|nr:L-glyceraldehyde 3-phosphate reductase [Flavilitoribacter nigricans]PHN07179.1 L-glyceraldehyde 3-phosphate reductase [Flavilitoribacter nigricans DSM 23189 = NBRC 102662]
MRIGDKTNPIDYRPAEDRYDDMTYRRSGKSGILLPAISIGLWHNFGHIDRIENGRNILKKAFDLGITHFDLANNYGPPFGSAEENFGTIMKRDFLPYRDELFISSKAGYDMWPGPYGNFGSRKYLIASLDQSLQRMGLDYVDLFYHHRPDPDTPLEETMGALDQIVRQGKALYVGISNYPADETANAAAILKDLGTPCLIHQVKYSMFDREPEDKLLDTLEENGIGCITFSPLAQGMLTKKYVDGIPEDSRAGKNMTYLAKEQVEAKQPKIKALNDLAQKRGQELAQMALVWLLRDPRVTSVLIGASSPEQLAENVASLEQQAFSDEELQMIESILQ